MELEKQWDRDLRIQTTGRDEANADACHHPYEPTPYCVLERLADSGLIGGGDTVLDYGCGKGRVEFFLAHRTGARALGIEYDRRIYRTALENKMTGAGASRVEFLLTGAETYQVPEAVNRCYFFNPFSVEILRRVMARILASYYDAPREVLLFFYYPSDEFVGYLMMVEELEFYDEIECDDLFTADPRERILIFRLPDYDPREEDLI